MRKRAAQVKVRGLLGEKRYRIPGVISIHGILLGESSCVLNTMSPFALLHASLSSSSLFAAFYLLY